VNEIPSYEALEFGVANGQQLVRWQEHFRLDDQRIAHGLGTRLGARQSDLLDLAVAIYVTDRLRRRRPLHARDDGRWWSRRLPVRLAVRDPAFWNGAELAGLLHRLLAWLTDDDWQIEFEAHPSSRRWAETQEPLFPETVRAPAQAGLFSGGLDSLLGAHRDAMCEEGELLLVAADTHNRLSHLQQQLARALNELTPRPLRLLTVPVGLTSAARRLSDGAEEESQRSRGFLFLAFGIVVANAAGLDQLRVYENGVGALNLPLTSAQRGSMNTRAMRPETLAMMSRLACELLERPFEIVNPSFWMTKAQMCAAAPRELHELIAKSVSCDTGLTHRADTTHLCGQCTSCLLRRQALLAAGLSDVDALDVLQMRGDVLACRQTEHAAPWLVCMLAQAMTTERAIDQGRWAGHVDAYPELASARRELGCEPERLLELLERYVSDWRALPSPVVGRFLAAAAPHS
jgi:7-cyano-7-deazaguanine synthase in queuosine biosynthesis